MKVLRQLFIRLRHNPPMVLGMTFGALILLGAVLLSLPISSADGTWVPFVDALFTSSSATCVTGLVVRNTAVGWSWFGKLVIITLIQIGGLGTMTIIALISMILRRRIGLKERLAIREQLNAVSMSGVVRLIKYVVSVTIAIESVGAVILSACFIPQYGWKLGIIYGVFHGVSAFCNAGFDLLGSSIIPYQTHVVVNLTIMGLVIIGGLGFGVYVDVAQKRRYRNFSMHTKLVLVTSAVLLIGGTLGLLALEWSNEKTLGQLDVGGKVLAAAFQSTIARTAGFSSIDLSGLSTASAFLLIILMFIGGSPGSTAGGLKTTTVGVLFFTTLAVIKGEDQVVYQRRTISNQVIRKAFVMAFICILVVIVVTCTVTVIERDRFSFVDILYECVSAFATVGVSRGITEDLSTASKVVLSFTMFLGRVGPTTLALGIGRRAKKKKIRYAEGSLLIG